MVRGGRLGGGGVGCARKREGCRETTRCQQWLVGAFLSAKATDTRGLQQLPVRNPCAPKPARLSPAFPALHHSAAAPQVAPGGGPVSATLLLVASRYGVMHVAGGVHRSPRAQEERVNRALVQRGEVGRWAGGLRG